MPRSPEASLPKLLSVLEELRQLDPEMPTQTAMAFLMVAHAMPEGMTQHELGLKLGISKSAAQRNVKALSQQRAVNTPGHGLLDVSTPPENGKMRLLQLSSKGQKIAAKLLKLLD